MLWWYHSFSHWHHWLYGLLIKSKNDTRPVVLCIIWQQIEAYRIDFLYNKCFCAIAGCRNRKAIWKILDIEPFKAITEPFWKFAEYMTWCVVIILLVLLIVFTYLNIPTIHTMAENFSMNNTFDERYWSASGFSLNTDDQETLGQRSVASAAGQFFHPLILVWSRRGKKYISIN